MSTAKHSVWAHVKSFSTAGEVRFSSAIRFHVPDGDEVTHRRPAPPLLMHPPACEHASPLISPGPALWIGAPTVQPPDAGVFDTTGALRPSIATHRFALGQASAASPSPFGSTTCCVQPPLTGSVVTATAPRALKLFSVPEACVPPTTHRETVGQESAAASNVDGSVGPALHGPAAGSVEVATLPFASIATHSIADGQETAVICTGSGTAVAVHLPEAGAVVV